MNVTESTPKAVRHGKVMPLVLVTMSVLSVSLGVGVGIGGLLVSRASRSIAPGTTETRNQVVPPRSDPPATIHSLGEMIVNLADLGQLRYAKLTVAAGFPDKLDDDKLKDYDPMLRDAVIFVVTRKRFEELHRVGGLDELKEELRAEFCRRLPAHPVSEVYLEAFGMQ
jgi:flagellar FliL protein